MPRPPSRNTYQVTFKIPEDWMKQADALAASMAPIGVRLTRTDALRAALARGLETLSTQSRGKRP